MDRKSLEDALIKAHESGDVEAARLFADEIKNQKSSLSGLPSFSDVTSSVEFARQPLQQETRGGAAVGNINLLRQGKSMQRAPVDVRGEFDPTRGGTNLRPFGIDTGIPLPESLSNILAGAGRAFSQTGQGVSQIVGAGPTAEQVDYRKSLDEPLLKNKSGMLGNVIGDVAQIAPAMFIPGINTIAGGAISGGVLGAAKPVGENDDRLQNAAISAALGAAIPTGIAAYKTGKSLVEPLYARGREAIAGRLLNRVSSPNSPTVAGRLSSATEIIPGSAPTAAEVAESGGVSALQRAMSAADPEAYTQRAMEQSSARLNALRGIAGEEGKRELFDAARKSAANDLYRQAYSAGMDLRRDAVTGKFLPAKEIAARKDEISKLLSAPSMQEAISRAKRLMQDEIQSTANPAGSVQGLDYARRALNDMIGEAPRASNQQRILIGLRDRLDDTLNKLSPKYAEARATFAEMSKPINQMDVGKALLDKFEPALSDYGALGRETAAKYATALRNEGESVARAATGMRGGLSSVMTPEQMKLINDVARDLARKANAQDLGRGVGSDTFQKFSMANIAEQSGMPKAVNFATSLPGLSRATNWVYRDSDQQLRELLARTLLSPKDSARLMLMQQQPGAINLSRLGIANPVLSQAPTFGGILGYGRE